MSRVTCPNVGNPRTRLINFRHLGWKCPNLIGLVLRIFNIWTSNPWLGGVYKVHGKSRLQWYEIRYVGSLFYLYLIHPLFWGFWGRGWPLKRLKWQKSLRVGSVQVKRTPSTTNPRILRFSWGWHYTSLKKNLPLSSFIFWYLKSAIPVCWCKLAYSWQSKLQSPSILDKLLNLHKSYNDLYLARFQQDSNYWLDETGPCIWPVNKNLCVRIK